MLQYNILDDSKQYIKFLSGTHCNIINNKKSYVYLLLIFS